MEVGLRISFGYYDVGYDTILYVDMDSGRKIRPGHEWLNENQIFLDNITYSVVPLEEGLGPGSLPQSSA